MKKYTLLVAGERVDLEFENTAGKITAKVGDRAYAWEATQLKPGLYWLHWNGQSIEIAVMPSEDSYSITVGEKRVPVEILDSRRKLLRTTRHEETGISEIRAPMAGKVVRVLAQVGETVNLQQGIVVMEAMKMQNEIRSPRAGRVLKLSVSGGETVGSGALLAVVESR